MLRLGILRIKLDRVLELNDGFVHPALSSQRHAQIISGFRISGSKLYGLLQLNDRLVEPSLTLVRHPQVVGGFRVLGLYSQGLLEFADRLVNEPFSAQSDAK